MIQGGIMSPEEKGEEETKSFLKKYFENSPSLEGPKQSPPSSLVQKFIDRIVKTFDGGIRADQPLSGRIRSIVPKIEEILEKFAELEGKYHDEKDAGNDGGYILFFQIVIKPLIREGNQLKVHIEKGKAATQARLFTQYVDWMDKSYKWLDCYHVKERDELEQELVKHITLETLSYIDKDIQVIQDYEKQQLDKIDFGNPRKDQLIDDLSKILNPLYSKMRKLQAIPEESSLEDILKWQRRIEASRQKLFEKALSVIDDMLHQEIPLDVSEEEQEHLIDVLQQIIELEQLIPSLNYFNHQISDPAEKKRLLDRVKDMQRETHNLSLDLRLSQDLFDRLQEIMKSLSIVYRQIDK